MAKAKTKPADAPASEPESVSGDGKVFFKLNHTSHKPGCEGIQGEVIRLAPDDVAYFLARNGGDVCDANGVPAKRSKPAPVVATQTDEDADDSDDDGEDTGDAN